MPIEVNGTRLPWRYSEAVLVAVAQRIKGTARHLDAVSIVGLANSDGRAGRVLAPAEPSDLWSATRRGECYARAPAQIEVTDVGSWQFVTTADRDDDQRRYSKKTYHLVHGDNTTATNFCSPVAHSKRISRSVRQAKPGEVTLVFVPLRRELSQRL